jgi:uncharacterized protein YkwD
MRGAPRTGLGLAVAGLVAAGLLIPTAAVAQSACKPAASPASEKALTKLIAVERKAAKVAKVAKDPVLVKAGRKKSLQMARGGKFAHSGSMAWAQGRSGAQNLAMAPTAELAMKAMLASGPHRANIRSGEWRITGVGAAADCQGQIFFTVNFAGPPA